LSGTAVGSRQLVEALLPRVNLQKFSNHET